MNPTSVAGSPIPFRGVRITRATGCDEGCTPRGKLAFVEMQSHWRRVLRPGNGRASTKAHKHFKPEPEFRPVAFTMRRQGGPSDNRCGLLPPQCPCDVDGVGNGPFANWQACLGFGRTEGCRPGTSCFGLLGLDCYTVQYDA